MSADQRGREGQEERVWRAVVVDEWALFRQGIRSVLAHAGMVVEGDVAGTDEALLRLWSVQPDLLVAGSPAQGSVVDLVARAARPSPAWPSWPSCRRRSQAGSAPSSPPVRTLCSPARPNPTS